MFVLYSTLGCHLCDDAKDILIKAGLVERLAVAGEVFPASNGRVLSLVDISEDEGLFVEYGVRIPVLVYSESGKELSWPFDLMTAREFISANS